LTSVPLLILPNIVLAGQFKVVRVYEGDTVKAVGHDIEIKVRLVGIDAPEPKKGNQVSRQARFADKQFGNRGFIRN